MTALTMSVMERGEPSAAWCSVSFSTRSMAETRSSRALCSASPSIMRLPSATFSMYAQRKLRTLSTATLRSLASLKLVSDLKVAVDNVRSFLWAYIEKVADGNRMMLGEALHSARLDRVSAMLRVLNETEHQAALGSPRSITDIVNAVIRNEPGH